MQSTLLRKLAIGAAATGAALTFNPFNHAQAAQGDGPRAAIRQCVTKNQRAREKALTEFKQAVRAARDLPQGQQQAAIQAAQSKFQQAAEAARSTFQDCIEAARPSN
jgi:hypothetical protein